jgi:hypothetical protein
MSTDTQMSTTTNTKLVVNTSLCLACLEMEKKNIATETFEDVPMCGDCHANWKDHQTYLTYYEWSCGWGNLLERLQEIAQTMRSKKN